MSGGSAAAGRPSPDFLAEPEHQMSLVEHARRELELCGQFAEDPAYAQSVVAAVAVFASYGHSGGSAMCAVEQLTTLLRYGVLSPLTADPDEWIDRTDMSDGHPLWQSRRQPAAFSPDGGQTFYLVDEPRRTDGSQRMYPAEPAQPVNASVGHRGDGRLEGP